MTRTEERLADALGAAACTVREDTLSPLIVPSRQRRTRHAWVAPIAAAVALLLAVGVGAVVSGNLPGAGHAAPVTAAAGPPPRYYVASEINGPGSTLVVRATGTGAMTDSLQIQSLENRNLAVPDNPAADFYMITAAADGEFFVAAGQTSAPDDDISLQLYRFRLTSAGRIAGLSQVPDGAITGPVVAMAASPDGSELAVSVEDSEGSARVLVINTATGARSVWQGGMARSGDQFFIDSLSWTGNGQELVFLAQWIPSRLPLALSRLPADAKLPSPIVSAPMLSLDAEVWALEPASGGGALDAGQMLLRQSARYPDIEQAAISADGMTLTAVVGSRPAGATTPQADYAARPFSIDQISVATGRQLGTLYQGTADLAVSQLISEGLGGPWLILGIKGVKPPQTTFSGWISDGRLIALPGINQYIFSEAWSASVPNPPAHPVVRPSTPAGTPPHYYVETDSDGQVVARSTATGSVTAVVGVPRSSGQLVTEAGDGTYFVATGPPGNVRWPGPELYKFRLTGAGQVTGLSKIPGGPIGTGQYSGASAIAAAPDGTQVAVAIDPSMAVCSGVPCASAEAGKGADYIAVVNAATGARSLWQGGMPSSLSIPSLSWTANGRELVFLGQTCEAGPSRSQFLSGCEGVLTPPSPAPGQGSSKALSRESSEVWALDPVPGGGRLGSAHRLLGQSAAYQDIAQAVISPDGSTITAVVMNGSASLSPPVEALVSVVQISVASGAQLRVLYRQAFDETEYHTAAPFVSPAPAPYLTADSTGRYWLLDVAYSETNGAVPNGWIRAGQLVELPPSGASVASEAW
jgi:hypothetical protein